MVCCANHSHPSTASSSPRSGRPANVTGQRLIEHVAFRSRGQQLERENRRAGERIFQVLQPDWQRRAELLYLAGINHVTSVGIDDVIGLMAFLNERDVIWIAEDLLFDAIVRGNVDRTILN